MVVNCPIIIWNRELCKYETCYIGGSQLKDRLNFNFTTNPSEYQRGLQDIMADIFGAWGVWDGLQPPASVQPSLPPPPL